VPGLTFVPKRRERATMSEDMRSLRRRDSDMEAGVPMFASPVSFATSIEEFLERE
jgi:hypothetical protein